MSVYILNFDYFVDTVSSTFTVTVKISRKKLFALRRRTVLDNVTVSVLELI